MQPRPPLHEPSDVSTLAPVFLTFLKNPGRSEMSDLPALPVPKEEPQITAPLQHRAQAMPSQIGLQGGKGELVIQTNPVFCLFVVGGCVGHKSIYESQATF